MRAVLGGLFSANEALVRPHVAPVSVASAVGDPDFVEIAVDGLKSIRALKVEDDVGVLQQHRLSGKDADRPRARGPQRRRSRMTGSIQSSGLPGEWLVFVREIHFRLNAACALGRIASLRACAESRAA